MKTFLLVEDNDDEIALTLRAFKKNNLVHDIKVLRDGVQALDYLFCRGDYMNKTFQLPAVMLLDLKLPKLGGLEVLKTLRDDSRTRCLPVVVLTSSTERSDVYRSYSLGANSYIRKPTDFDEFVDTVKHLGFYWSVLNEPTSLVEFDSTKGE